MQTTLDLDSPETWPQRLRTFLDAHHRIFLGWEIQGNDTSPELVISGAAFDQAIYALCDVLRDYTLVGWHCTRLTGSEIAAIAEGGMQLPDLEMLKRRIDAIEADGLVAPSSSASGTRGLSIHSVPPDRRRILRTEENLALHINGSARSPKRPTTAPGQIDVGSNSSARRPPSEPRSQAAEPQSNKCDAAVSCSHSIFS
jgi:hypothetical protein